jgi:hypothetical protein
MICLNKILLIIFMDVGQGHQREILQGRTKLLWGPGYRLKLLSKLRFEVQKKPLVNFHMCFISCATECPDNIYFIQSSDKHAK